MTAPAKKLPPVPGVLGGRDLRDRVGAWLADELGDTEQAGRVLDALANVITDAAAWRAYWDPAEHAARLQAELDVAREMDAAEWAPVARHVRSTAQRMLTT